MLLLAQDTLVDLNNADIFKIWGTIALLFLIAYFLTNGNPSLTVRRSPDFVDKGINKLIAKSSTDKVLLNFIAPNQTLVDIEKEICDRLFGFERHISELDNSTEKNIIDKNQFESVAKTYFKTYLKFVGTKLDNDHQDFLKQLGGD